MLQRGRRSPVFTRRDMQFLDAAGRKELQKFAKEYGIKVCSFAHQSNHTAAHVRHRAPARFSGARRTYRPTSSLMKFVNSCFRRGLLHLDRAARSLLEETIFNQKTRLPPILKRPVALKRSCKVFRVE